MTEMEVILTADQGAPGAVPWPVLLDAATLEALAQIPVLIAAGQVVGLDAATLAALEAVAATVTGTVSVDNIPAEFPLPNVQVAALAPQTDALTNVELRAAPVSTRDAGVRASAHQVIGPVVDQVLIAAGTDQVVLRKFHLHADPALAAGTFPVVTVQLGTQVIFRDKFEPGLPYAEGIPIFADPGEDLTISIDQAATVYVNVRYELI